MSQRNTHTSKKYAIDLINEFRAKALEKVEVSSEPCILSHKQDAVLDGSAVYVAMSKIKQACRLRMKEAALGNGRRYGHHMYGTTIEIEERFIETPVSYKEAVKAHKKALPRQRKQSEKINAVHEEAERAIMLGGTDTQIAKAVSKLERLLKVTGLTKGTTCE
jgi:hypothetical protein